MAINIKKNYFFFEYKLKLKSIILPFKMSKGCLILLKKYQNVIKKFSSFFNNAKPKDRHKFIYPLRSAGISFSHAKELGYNIKKKHGGTVMIVQRETEVN